MTKFLKKHFACCRSHAYKIFVSNASVYNKESFPFCTKRSTMRRESIRKEVLRHGMDQAYEDKTKSTLHVNLSFACPIHSLFVNFPKNLHISKRPQLDSTYTFPAYTFELSDGLIEAEFKLKHSLALTDTFVLRTPRRLEGLNYTFDSRPYNRYRCCWAIHWSKNFLYIVRDDLGALIL